MEVTTYELKHFVKKKYYGRGREYFLEGRGRIVSRTKDRVIAVVSGTQLYSVQLWRSSTGRLAATCTCPAVSGFGNCKHMACVGLMVVPSPPAAKKQVSAPIVKANSPPIVIRNLSTPPKRPLPLLQGPPNTPLNGAKIVRSKSSPVTSIQYNPGTTPTIKHSNTTPLPTVKIEEVPETRKQPAKRLREEMTPDPVNTVANVPEVHASKLLANWEDESLLERKRLEFFESKNKTEIVEWLSSLLTQHSDLRSIVDQDIARILSLNPAKIQVPTGLKENATKIIEVIDLEAEEPVEAPSKFAKSKSGDRVAAVVPLSSQHLSIQGVIRRLFETFGFVTSMVHSSGSN